MLYSAHLVILGHWICGTLSLEATPDLDFMGHLTSVVASLRSFLLAYLAITATEPRQEGQMVADLAVQLVNA